jgi:hypothetical protein
LLGRAAPCLDCLPGQFGDDVGLKLCKDCARGRFATALGATTEDICVECNAGEYSNIPGAQRCQQCSPGQFSDSPGASVCPVCENGKMSEVNETTFCTDCPYPSRVRLVHFPYLPCSLPIFLRLVVLTHKNFALCVQCIGGQCTIGSVKRGCGSCDRSSDPRFYQIGVRCQECPTSNLLTYALCVSVAAFVLLVLWKVADFGAKRTQSVSETKANQKELKKRAKLVASKSHTAKSSISSGSQGASRVSNAAIYSTIGMPHLQVNAF